LAPIPEEHILHGSKKYNLGSVEVYALEISLLVLTAWCALVGTIALLPLFGFDLRFLRRPRVLIEQAGALPRPTRVTWIALALVIVSLALSSGAFYYFFRPRIVEKTVEKIVEEMVSTPRPEQKEPALAPIPKAKVPKPSGPVGGGQIPVPDKANDSSKPPQTVINAPNGIGISGGHVENPTVNNYSPPARHIPPEMREELIAILRPIKGTADVNVAGFDYEPDQFANELNALFREAGWTIKNPIVPNITLPAKGVELVFRGTPKQGEEQIALPVGPVREVVHCLRRLNVSVSGNPLPNVPEDEVRLTVGSNVP
jgi:hypothetical protein